MTPPQTWPPDLAGLVETVAGCPIADIGWRELVRVRDAVDLLLDVEVNRLQAAGDAA